jgi:hypothetical protein
MKKYNKLVTGSLLTALIFSTPAIGLADNNKNEDQKNKIKTELSFKQDDDNKENNKIEKENKIEEKNQRKEDLKENKENSFFRSSWFKNHSSKIVNAPVISNITTVSTKTNKATIKWTTDNRANSYAWISTTSPVDTSVKPTLKRNDRVLKHKIEMKKLQPNTKYYVIVGSANNKGMIKSTEVSFTTPENNTDTKSPVISNIDVKINSDKNVVVSWKTDEPATSSLYYSTVSPLDLSASTTLSIIDSALVTNHVINIPSLTSSTLYHFTLKSVDTLSNIITSSEFSFKTK